MILYIAALINPFSKTKYGVINHKIEKWYKIIDIVTVKVSPPTIFLPKLIIGYFNYFTTDLGNAAFKLPNPMW